MGTERYRFLTSTTSSLRATRQERPPSLADSSLSGSTPNPNMTGTRIHDGIPTIEISDSVGNRRSGASSVMAKGDHHADPIFGSYGRTPSPNLREGFSSSKLAALKRKAYDVLSFGHDEQDDDKGRDHEDGLLNAPSTDLPGLSSASSTCKRRAVSMPLPEPQKHAQMDTDSAAARGYLAPGSPPIVDFTRFEDRYRSPSSDYDALFSFSGAKKNDNGRKATSSFSSTRSGRPGSVFVDKTWRTARESVVSGKLPAVGVMMRNSSSRNVLYPANERKPDPRLIMDALEDVSGTVDIRGVLNVDDLLRIFDVDQEDFELRVRDGETDRKSRVGKTRTVFGESIQNVFRYASTTIILGEIEYILPIVVLHCVEEVYRTGIYQPNLFRTLPNRPRLHELISIFDSEEQPAGSIIRSRQSIPTTLEGFGAATSLHLESTPDICALLTSYISALPESILPPNLFEAIWKLCEVDKQPHNHSVEPRPAPDSPGPLSSVPLARSHPPRCEATYILIAQLVLHLLPSPQFFLFVYLLSFFSQVALVREENGVGIEDLSKMFGTRIFGHGNGVMSSTKSSPALDPSKSNKAKGKEKERNGRGEVLMIWFLRRWRPLSETLFEVADDAKLGVLHRNKLMRKDSLGKAAMTFAYTAADGERDEEVENLVERELLEHGDVRVNVDLPEPVNVVESPATVHVPIAMDSQKRDVSSSIAFARRGLGLLSLPQGNATSSRNVAGGPMREDVPQSSSSSVSSGSSSSTLPPYTARTSPNTIESDFNHTAASCLPLPTERPICLGQGIFPNTNLHHSTPKRMFGPMTRSVGNTNHSDEAFCPSPVMVPQQQDRVITNVESIDQSIEDGESTPSLPSLHERLLDVSMPITIFDFDETMPVGTSVGGNSPSLLSSRTSTFSVTPKQEHEPHAVKLPGRNLTPWKSSISRIPSITDLKQHTIAFSNTPTGTLPLRPGSDRHRPSVSSILNNECLSPLPAPPVPAKSSERTRTRSQPRLPVSQSAGFQNQSQFLGVPFPAAAIGDPSHDEHDVVINALRERLVEVEKERDEARRIVTEVRRALRNTDDGSLHTLLS